MVIVGALQIYHDVLLFGVVAIYQDWQEAFRKYIGLPWRERYDRAAPHVMRHLMATDDDHVRRKSRTPALVSTLSTARTAAAI